MLASIARQERAILAFLGENCVCLSGAAQGQKKLLRNLHGDYSVVQQ